MTSGHGFRLRLPRLHWAEAPVIMRMGVWLRNRFSTSSVNFRVVCFLHGIVSWFRRILSLDHIASSHAKMQRPKDSVFV
jgi:hypothetical protein